MSTAVDTTPTSTVVTRERVGWLDLAWLTWRQHRAALLSTTVAVLALCGWMVWNDQLIVSQREVRTAANPFAGEGNLSAINHGYDQVYLVAVFAGIIAVFWAAPLLAREYEQRTQLVVWSQDVRRGRWLLGKVLPLGLAAVLLALLLGVMADRVTGTIAANSQYGISLYARLVFEAYPGLQVAYVLFGFAFGLLCSAVFRRILPATAVTLVGYVVVRVVVGIFRFDYLAPVHYVTPFTGMFTQPPGTGDDWAMVGNGYLTASGQSLDGAACDTTGQYDFQKWVTCMSQHGATQQFTDYHTAGQVVGFRLIEIGVFLVLTVICGVLTWSRMRRSETV